MDYGYNGAGDLTSVADRYGRQYQTFQIGLGCCFSGSTVASAGEVLGYKKLPSPAALKNFISGTAVSGGVSGGPGLVTANWGLPFQRRATAWSVEEGLGPGLGAGVWASRSYTIREPPPRPAAPPYRCEAPVEQRFNNCYIQQ